MKILITGSTGFVGRGLIGSALARRDISVRCATRDPSRAVGRGVEDVVVGNITADTSWRQALADVDGVVHLAAKVHVQPAGGRDVLDSYRALNVAGSVNLARQAADAGVSRFVFLSSVKVNGEEGRFSESDSPAPIGPYGISKHEAELGLRRVAEESQMEVAIIRPPLVYGPGVRANFRTLMRAISLGIPLPFGAVANKRSFVALDNLVDFIFVCLEHPAAANETFFVSDGLDLSTPELLRRLSAAIGKPARLVAVPQALLMAGATFLGQRSLMQRLVGSLQVEISKARQRLGWEPVTPVDEALRRAVESPE